MSWDALYIWVEGNDDERYMNRIVVPIIERDFEYVKVIKYAGERPGAINKYIEGIRGMAKRTRAGYIFFTDIDDAPCITERKKRAIKKYKALEGKNVLVVISEIESWYLAGLRDEDCERLNIRRIDSTDNICKEEFEKILPKRFKNRVLFIAEILDCYSVEIAREKNTSLAYFLSRLDCLS
ncbi:MAG: hypothetical protein SWK76_17205 [Actinomycetota bacterium]|nr:hypothetical protein [Actinomycetota bacterium]